ncbi:MAG TPA: 50S ribosomal protein L4 [Candidatus Hydrogenedentes bacterium]|nr:50S ribosomal protein L4 [Candidatus Hydrogenedentota bacterium]
MASVKVVDMSGADQGVREVADKVFAAPFNETVVHEAVLALRNAARQGTHKTKTRKEVSGGGAKPFRQKGTGRSRQGSSREPQMRGGGTVFGPIPRSYRQAVSVRVKRQAICCALSDRLREDRLSVLAGLLVEQPKTKPFAAMMARLSPEGRKTLLVTADMDQRLLLSARNIPHVTVRTASDLNVLDVMLANRVIVQEEALQPLEERLS